MANEADFYIKTGDVEPAIDVQLLNDDGSVVDLRGSRALFAMQSVGAEERAVESEATIYEPDDGKLKYEWETSDTADSGYYNAIFGIEYDAVQSATETFTYDVNTDIYSVSNEGIIQQGYYDVVVRDTADVEYEEGSDYAIIDNSDDGRLDAIDWTGAENEPTDGDQFTIEYSYALTEDISPDETFPNVQYIVVRVDEGL